jgi:carboxyl-terminal processing protease
MNSRKIIYWIILVLLFIAVFLFGIWIGVKKIAYNVPQPDAVDFSLFWDAYNKLKDNFINPSEITSQKIIYGAIRGMTDSLGDDYTNFFDPNQAQKFQEDLSGSFDGIGVEIGIKKDLLTIISPLKGTPGEEAGLKSGDVILKIDGQDSASMTTDEAINLIRGPKGTKIILTILRDDWDSAKDIEIIRDTIEIPSIEWSLKDPDIAYMQINQFGDTLSSDFERIALEILQSPAKKIILDLRSNPGGYLSTAQDIAGWFLEKGKIVTI